MKKRMVRMVFTVAILVMMGFSVMNFFGTLAMANPPGNGQNESEVEGTWVSSSTCSKGWICIPDSSHNCWCASASRYCCNN